jgi:hypothetical protein
MMTAQHDATHRQHANTHIDTIADSTTPSSVCRINHISTHTSSPSAAAGGLLLRNFAISGLCTGRAPAGSSKSTLEVDVGVQVQVRRIFRPEYDEYRSSQS